MTEPQAKQSKPRIGRIILAFVLDLFGSFFGFGFLIAYLTGNLTETGFDMNGAPAFFTLGLVLAYMIIPNWFGGTLWQRILGARKLR